MDTLSQSIVGSMQSTVVNSYRDTFQKVLVPNFEKSCQNMYQQVNASFAKGTQDYLIEFDQLAKQQRKQFDDNKEPIELVYIYF
jgi:enhancer of mRNA-decapping protein 4